MEIIGIGVDICKNSRIEALIKKYEMRFLEKVFSDEEIALCLSKYKEFNSNFFSKRFAGKEAFVKALGLGFNQFIKKNEIVILNDPIYNKPTLKVMGETRQYIDSRFHKNLQFFISMSDEKEFSVANTLITRIVIKKFDRIS